MCCDNSMSPKKAKPKRLRKKPHPSSRSRPGADTHAGSIAQSTSRMMSMMHELRSHPAPLSEADHRIDGELEALTMELAGHRPERVIELARLACLPWAIAGQTKPGTDGGPAIAELLALIALASSSGQSDGSASDETPNGLYQQAHAWAKTVETLMFLLQARRFLTVIDDAPDDLAHIAMSARSREVWVRNTSYPDMVKTTLDLLFSGASISLALTANLGFDAEDAYLVLTKLHEIQVEAMNERMIANHSAMRAASESGPADPDPVLLQQMKVAWNSAWQPTADLVTVSAPALVDALGLKPEVVDAVLNRFAVELNGQSPREVLDAFLGGDNPFRTNPVVRSDRDEFMMVHDALILPAIRENLEQELKRLPAWEAYQQHRGDVLEEIGKATFEKVFPGVESRSAFDYFVPANELERAGEPAGYTKKVEGDLLLILDDVAVIVEAKAVALTPAARVGESRKLRRNLVDIITKASDQAARLQRCIEDDGGVRLHKHGWLDLSHVREIHTVALSLEDLSSVATATSELVEAKLLDAERIPWVVSIHDLQVIVDLVDRPAEFLLYLRRRRDPEVSLAYASSDELDLFLYFYEKGLYVSPDPAIMAEAFAHISTPRTADVRRRANQRRIVISSRTDPLDAWHYAQIDPTRPQVKKPILTRSPMVPLADEVQRRGVYGWLSLGATLLSGSTKTQADWSRIPKKLLSGPLGGGRERSISVPIGTTLGNAWLLVWSTRPAEREIDEIRKTATDYLRAKKYQLKFSRGAVFVYDEADGTLLDVLYDGTLPTPDPSMDEAIRNLFPAEKMSSAPPPKAKRPSKPKRKPGRR